jgi:hypothetical protein
LKNSILLPIVLKSKTGGSRVIGQLTVSSKKPKKLSNLKFKKPIGPIDDPIGLPVGIGH